MKSPILRGIFSFNLFASVCNWFDHLRAPPFTTPLFTVKAHPTAVGAVPIDISTSWQSSGILYVVGLAVPDNPALLKPTLVAVASGRYKSTVNTLPLLPSRTYTKLLV